MSPVMMAREALKNAGSGKVNLRTDTATQVQNCTRAGKKLGWNVSVSEREGYYELTFTRQP